MPMDGRPETLQELLRQRAARLVEQGKARASDWPDDTFPAEFVESSTSQQTTAHDSVTGDVIQGEIVSDGIDPNWRGPNAPRHAHAGVDAKRDGTLPHVKRTYPIGQRDTGDSHDFPQWGPWFLAEYRNSGNPTAACHIAGIQRKTFDRHYAGNSAFRDACDEAYEESIDMLEAHARLRATVYNSDRVLLRMLEAERPEKWAPNKIGPYHLRRMGAASDRDVSRQQRLADNRAEIERRLLKGVREDGDSGVYGESDSQADRPS